MIFINTCFNKNKIYLGEWLSLKNLNKIKLFLMAFIPIILLILLDQLSKIWIVSNLKDKADIILIPNVLQLHYLENTGAAFSIMNHNMMWFFYIITPLISIVLFYILWKCAGNKKHQLLYWIMIFLIAGAFGNYIDRIYQKYVVDFIYVSLINFPVFNIADIYVTCSVVMLFITVIFLYSEEDFEELGLFKHGN